MKIEMMIKEISCKFLSKVESQLSYPPLNLKRILEDDYEIWKKLSKCLVWVSPWIHCNTADSYKSSLKSGRMFLGS